jgi:hypothetical protein
MSNVQNDQNEQTIDEIILEKMNLNRDAIIASAISEMEESIKKGLAWRIESKISDVISELFEKDIAPELEKRIKEEKVSIVDSIFKSLPDISVEVGKALTAKVSKNLSDSYRSGKVFEEMFK